MRSRAVRLLTGRFRAEDLSRLFLYARDRCSGSEPVREIGDFIAHHDERVKGPVTRSVRDFFAVVTFQMTKIRTGLPDPFGSWLPPGTPEFLRACLRRMENKILSRSSRLSRAEADRTLPGLIAKLIERPDGSFCIGDLSDEEFALLRTLCSFLVVKPAFDGDRLYEDLKNTLLRLNILQRSELVAFEGLKGAVVVTAMAAMHNCQIRLEDNSLIALSANYSATEGQIGALAPVPIPGGGPKMACYIFSATGPMDLFCEPELMATEDWEALDLEVSDQGKLVAIS